MLAVKDNEPSLVRAVTSASELTMTKAHSIMMGKNDLCPLAGNLYKGVKDPNLIAKISGHVENPKAFSRYRDIVEEMAKETIMKLE